MACGPSTRVSGWDGTGTLNSPVESFKAAINPHLGTMLVSPAPSPAPDPTLNLFLSVPPPPTALLCLNTASLRVNLAARRHSKRLARAPAAGATEPRPAASAVLSAVPGAIDLAWDADKALSWLSSIGMSSYGRESRTTPM